MNAPQRSARRARRGFTLVELMIALAAGGFTIAAAYSLARVSAANYAAQTQVSDTQVAVRTAMDQIRRDAGRAGFLGTRNVAEQPGCAGTPDIADVSASVTNIFGARVDIDGSWNATINSLLDLSRNPARLDSLTLWGNYATSDAYRIRGDLDENRTILRFQTNNESFRRSFFTPGTGGAAPTYDVTRFETAFTKRWVRVESDGKFWYRAVDVNGVDAKGPALDPNDPPTVRLAAPLPACFDYRFAIVSPLSRITYRVADLASDGVVSVALANLREATSDTPGARQRAVLVRQEEEIATGTVDPDDFSSRVRLVLDYATEFVVNGVADTDTTGNAPTFFHRDESSAPTIEAEAPERLRALRVRISARSADANPSLPHAPRANTNAPFVAFQVPIDPTNPGIFWASVRTMSAEIFLPNLVQQP
jgi:prepilin-type N-terminal cleavage/methylation domain-containing protein